MSFWRSLLYVAAAGIAGGLIAYGAHVAFGGNLFVLFFVAAPMAYVAGRAFGALQNAEEARTRQ